MSTRPTALVLEDARDEREELTVLLEGLGLEVWCTSSPVKARDWIGRHSDYDLAIIDWDMSKSEDADREATSRLVLEKLAREARETLTVVHAGNLMRVRVHEEIQRSHPMALLHDKLQGAESLQGRLVRILSPRVGDLQLDDRFRNHVHHLPSGRVFKHRVGFKLLTQAPQAVFIPRESSSRINGLRRFRHWLSEVGSNVSVVSLGMATHRYRLVVQGDGDAPDDARPR